MTNFGFKMTILVASFGAVACSTDVDDVRRITAITPSAGTRQYAPRIIKRVRPPSVGGQGKGPAIPER